MNLRVREFVSIKEICQMQYSDSIYHDEYHDEYGDIYRDVYVDDRYDDVPGGRDY